ncbi:stalk domain-containing protein [Bacillus tianshenii]|nr:stalk domain-containing protein [Bacillus tianshenii]
MKRRLSAALGLMLAFSPVMGQSAEASNDVSVKVGGDPVNIQPQPYISNDVTYIPLRDMFETLDADVHWDSEERYVLAKENGKKLKLFVDVNDAFINDKPFEIKHNPKIKNGRVFVPLRFVSETFGAQVQWNSDERSVNIFIPQTLDAADSKVQAEYTMTSTAYTANCEGCSGITRTGINLKENPDKKVVAVDPDVIPLGSKVWVEGYGTAVAGDIGSAIQGNKIDVFIPSREEALQYGRKQVKVKVLE